MKRPKIGGWFRPRRYPHFDYPLTFDVALSLVSDAKRVAQRSFLPLIGYTDIRRTFRTDNSSTLPRRQRPKKIGSKPRDIKYASHGDAAVYSYYAYKLQEAYDDWLDANELSASVIGYRSGLGSNVDLAASVFAEVASRQAVTCLCFDISDFFPSISHRELKEGIKSVLGCGSLSPDWYNVYKSISAHAWVELKPISIVLGFNPSDPPSPIVPDIGNALATLRSAKLIQSNKGNSAGIPQGTPISAVLANVSMARFDLAMIEWAKQNGASYRRYSDDILVICPPNAETAASAFVPKLANSIGGLVINPLKTEVSRFSLSGSVLRTDHILTYLGFSFDGERVSLRPRTLSRYYRRMTYAVRGTIRGAGRKGQPAANAYKRALFRDVSHLGSTNFYRYAAKADAKFSKTSNTIVKRQLRRHFQILIRKLGNRGR